MEALAAWNRLSQPKSPGAQVSNALSKAVHFLNNNYRSDIDLKELSQSVGMSYSVFRRTFHEHTGFAPWKYVQHMRLAHARHRLATSTDTIAQLADELGFSSPFHLSTAFSKEFGVSPMGWKKRARRKPFSSEDSLAPENLRA
jgi:AraC-like DNA-binding protein